jgi:sugar/nucleoside kinase (ribokinase family)
VPVTPRPVRALFAGLTTVDLVYRVAAVPGPNEKTTARSQELAAGGPAANAAVTFAALGGESILLSALGRHPLAQFAAAELASLGVTMLDATADSGAPPAVSSSYVTDGTGDRSVVSVNAAGSQVRPPAGLESLTAGLDAVLVDGHHPALALAAAAAGRAAGVPVILDGGSWKEILDRLLPLTDVAICSAAFRSPRPIQDLGPARIAVTRGPDPVLWWAGGEHGEVQVPAVRAADTHGAGDAFHGAYTYAAAAHPDAGFADALAFAARVAALRCSVQGPRAWLRKLRPGGEGAAGQGSEDG